MSQHVQQQILRAFGWADRYELLEKIGAGAMGQVWRAREIATDHIVALKMLDPARTGDEQILARLEIEGETLTKLRSAGQHEHVVPILDFQVTESHACIVMEFIPGLSLKKWCDTQRLGLRERVGLVAQISRAAGWFHGLGVVHRDLKPANILVNAVTHQPVIVDFSIAKKNEGLTLTLTNEALGTAPYMAPEQFDRRQAPISPATDVYALGATLYELLTHVHPHPGDFAMLLRRHLDEVRPVAPSVLNPAIPKDLECVLLKALSSRVSDRYADGTALADELDRFLSGMPVKARPVSTAGYLVRQARRRPAFTSALVACAALGMFSWWNTHRLDQTRALGALEAEVARLLQEPGGTTGVTEALDGTLRELQRLDPVKATLLGGAATQSMIRRAEETLRQSYVTPDALNCMERETLPWLAERQPQEAARLEKLIPHKRDHWDSRFILRAPFTDHGKLLEVKNGGLSVRERHLFPSAAGDTSPVPVKLRQGMQASSRLSLNLCPRQEVFDHFRIRVEGGERTLDFDLYHGSKAPPEWRDLVSASQGNGIPILLVCSRNEQPEQARVFLKPVVNGGPDRDYDHPFGVTLSILPDHVDFSVLGKGGVRVEDLFSFANPARTNQITFFWPSDLGLREMSASGVKGLGRGNMMEVADGYLLYKNMAAALAVYEQAFGHPEYRLEARHKAALVHWLEGRPEAAFSLWEDVSHETDGLWRDLSLFRLWFHTVEKHGTSAASPRLKDFSSVIGSLSPRFRQLLTTRDRQMIIDRYSAVMTQTSPWRASPTLIADALKAFQLVDASAQDSAGRLALALHLKGMDEAAIQLLAKLDPAKLVGSETPRTETLLPALDHWSRISPSEKAPPLLQALRAWRKARPAAPEFRFLDDVEQSRQAFRQNRLDDARRLLEPASLWERVALHVLLPGRLTKAALHHLDGQTAQALEEGRKASDALRNTQDLTSAERLDLAALSVLTRTWTSESTRTLLGPFFSSSVDATDIPALESALHSGVLGSARLVQELNSLIDTPEAALLLRHHASRQLNARQLFQQWGVLFMKCLFVSCLDTSLAETSATRLRQISGTVMQSWTDFTQTRASLDTFLLHFIQAPESSQTTALSLPPALTSSVSDLHWLLTCRYQTLGRRTSPPHSPK
jgi:predicted Ser/Thr protein kinase